MTEYDVVVIGAGHNGLICAAALARAGRKVVVVEAADSPGGCATTREFSPGFSVSACAQWLDQLAPEALAVAGLKMSDLDLAASELATVSLQADGNHVRRQGNVISGGQLSDKDQAAWRDWLRQSDKYLKLLSKPFLERAPRLVESDWRDKLALARLGIGMKLLGSDDMSDLLRIGLINVYDLFRERFDSPALQGMLAVDAVQGAHMAPRSPNTVFGYLYRQLGRRRGFTGPAVPRGGMGAVGRVLMEAAMKAGAEVRLSCPVERVLVTEQRASGVVLQGGETLASRLVVSNADPMTTLLQLVGARELETPTVRRVTNLRCKSGTAKLHLALNGLPSFTGLSAEDHGQRLLIAPTMDFLESGFNPIKYGEIPEHFTFDVSLPSLHDDMLAPSGQHVLSAVVQYLPYELAEGDWADRKSEVMELLLRQLEAYAPGLRDLVVGSELLTPADLEATYGMTRGHWHHAELGLDQAMMMRPFAGATQYATPLDGLYLCGAGSHPGGGVTGLPGRNAAQEILRRGDAA